MSLGGLVWWLLQVCEYACVCRCQVAVTVWRRWKRHAVYDKQEAFCFGCIFDMQIREYIYILFCSQVVHEVPSVCLHLIVALGRSYHSLPLYFSAANKTCLLSPYHMFTMLNIKAQSFVCCLTQCKPWKCSITSGSEAYTSPPSHNSLGEVQHPSANFSNFTWNSVCRCFSNTGLSLAVFLLKLHVTPVCMGACLWAQLDCRRLLFSLKISRILARLLLSLCQ